MDTLVEYLSNKCFRISKFRVYFHGWLIFLMLHWTRCNAVIAQSNPTAVDRSQWMKDLPDEWVNRPMTELAIPGSHDSGSYSLREDSELAPDMPQQVVNLVKAMQNVEVGDHVLKHLIHKWSVTQTRNITEQLQLGIRYLDLRLVRSKRDNQTYETGLTVLEKIEDKFQGRLYPRDLPLNVTIRQLWDMKKSILLFYSYSQELVKRKSSLAEYVRKKEDISSPFDRKALEKKDTWLKFIDNNYQRRLSSKGFHVTQGIMQPDWLRLLTSGLMLSESLQTGLADEATSTMCLWLRQCHAGTNGINIVITDFVENNNFTGIVLALNDTGKSTPSIWIISKGLLLYFIFLSLFG